MLPRNKILKISRKQFCFLVLLGLFLVIGFTIPGHLTLTKTDSVNYHLFWELNEAMPSRGNYVRLPLYDSAVGCNPCSIVKRIGCMPGDQMISSGFKYYCNGEYLGRARTYTQHLPFEFNGIVPVGMVFLVGDKDTSYDSRYFGFKPLTDIETVLLPLF